MKKEFTYSPTGGVCSRQIDVVIDGEGVLESVTFTGGCPGNTQGLVALAVGMKADEVALKLAGIDCKGRGTSCPDQLAQALKSSFK